MLKDTARLMDEGCRGGVFPGAVLVVVNGDKIVHQSCHGITSVEPMGVEVTQKTVFDLASLTKVVASTTLSLLAVENDELDLFAPIEQYLPQLRATDLGRVNTANLLEHTSGLPAWAPLYYKVQQDLGRENLCTVAARDAIRKLVRAQPLQAPAGLRAVYSDLGFILLDEVLESACGGDLELLFRTRVVEPLGLDELFFIDLKTPVLAESTRRGKSFAATQKCPWRGRVLVGEVHDQNTWAAGGVSGQAGLFGTARGVARLCVEWLKGDGGDSGFFRKDLVEKFWTRSRVENSTRTLGFDTKSPDKSQAGKSMGDRTVGHLGFTGTSVWIDPDKELIVVLLSNRIHPSVENESIKKFRPLIHDVIVAELFGDRK